MQQVCGGPRQLQSHATSANAFAAHISPRAGLSMAQVLGRWDVSLSFGDARAAGQRRREEDACGDVMESLTRRGPSPFLLQTYNVVLARRR